MERITQFVDVILPLNLSKLYTYRVPVNLNDAVKLGQRVIVQFGKNKLYSALIASVHTTAPSIYEAKYIESLLDDEPIVTSHQLVFWKWMSGYYMCSLGEVMNAAIPTGLKLSSESEFVLNEEFGNDYTSLSDNEFLIVEALQSNLTLKISDVEKILDKKTVYPIIKKLADKHVIFIREELKESYKPKLVSHIRLTDSYKSEEKLKLLFDQLNRTPAQLKALMSYIHWSHKNKQELIKKTVLVDDSAVSTSVITQLIKKEVFEQVEVEASRIELYIGENQEFKALSQEQEQAYFEIENQFRSHNVVLLHGVTASGKTEIYVKLIEEQIAKGKQVLYLLPEIALTTQIIARLRKYFGNKVLVYHSKYNSSERVEVWNTLLNFNTKTDSVGSIILGARSSIFLPFSDLGLVIIDEEHENSFKQYDPAPRYSARDAGIYLSSLFKSKTVLGSATPSIESFWNAQEGKYGKAVIDKRYGNSVLPEILIADIKEDTRKKKMKSHFSPLLVDEMTKALEQKEQIILFQNRRGFSPFMQCETCLHIPKCIRCDVSLTYHKFDNNLKCHYCGFKERPTPKCSACGSPQVKLKGFGTEKIEEELHLFFPDIVVKRMDLDTTRSKMAYQNIISDFEARKTHILVGTQMVTKGLDFDNVSLVGILNADNLLYFPDFRAYERSFQLMAQVSGRAGRKAKRGKVVIQTMNPYHSVILDVINNDYQSLYNSEIIQRINFKYPPFFRLIKLSLRHKDKGLLENASNYFSDILRKNFGDRILGPESPVVSRVRNYYYKEVLLKIERTASVKSAKRLLQDEIDLFLSQQAYKSIRVIIDVDPL